MIKCVGADPAPITAMRTDGSALCEARTVCDLAQRLGFLLDESDVLRVCRDGEVHRRRLDLAQGGTPSGRRDPRVCLRIGRPPRTPLNDVEPKRGIYVTVYS